MKIKEYMIKQDWTKRPLLEVKNTHNVQKLHDISGKYDSIQKVADMFYQIFDVVHLAEEYAWMLTVDSNCKITGVFEISHGSVNSTVFGCREIIQRALLAGAVNIIVAHCHPTGDPQPSDLDIQITKKLSDSCRLCGIPLLDHMILGCSEDRLYYSFREQGIITDNTWNCDKTA